MRIKKDVTLRDGKYDITGITSGTVFLLSIWKGVLVVMNAWVSLKWFVTCLITFQMNFLTWLRSQNTNILTRKRLRAPRRK